MRLQENFNEPEARLFPVGLAEELTYEVPELGRTMKGSSWMGFGFCPQFPEGDYETLVYHFYAKD